MNEQFIPYSEALLIKQLGFDEPCLSYYKNGEFSGILELVRNSEMFDYSAEYIAAPLYQQAFKFFREKYGLYCYVSPFISYEDERKIVYDIYIYLKTRMRSLTGTMTLTLHMKKHN